MKAQSRVAKDNVLTVTWFNLVPGNVFFTYISSPTHRLQVQWWLMISTAVLTAVPKYSYSRLTRLFHRKSFFLSCIV